MAQQHDKGKQWQDGKSVKQVAESDGTYSEQVAANLYAWDATVGAYVKLTVDHATGNLNVTGGGGGGGGAVTIADGADVAQGATTDTSSSNTVVGILKAIKAAITGTLSVSGSLGRTWSLSSGTDSVNVGNFPGTQPVSLATNTPDVTDRSNRLLGHVTVDTLPSVSGSVSVSNFPATQPVSGTVSVNEQATAADGGTEPSALKVVAGYDSMASVVRSIPVRVVNGDPQMLVRDGGVKAQLGEMNMILTEIRDLLKEQRGLA